MPNAALFAQALTVAYASGLNFYATIAIIGLADRMDWIGPLPGALGGLSHPVVIGVAVLLYLLDFGATLVPGIASAWDTFHTIIRPPAAAALAAGVAWNGNAGFIVAAALLGGGMGLVTHTTKLGLRYALDASPEPMSNAATNTLELGLLGALAVFVWQHPFLALAAALLILLGLILLVRRIWRMLVAVFSGRWVPSRGYLQEARGSVVAAPPSIARED